MVAHDICIIKFPDMSLKSRPTAARACLPPKNWHPKEGTKCWAAGWGIMEKNNIASDLQEVDLEIIADETCQKTANAGYLLDDIQFCAGTLKGGKDACQG
jgi:hypothetical protein